MYLEARHRELLFIDTETTGSIFGYHEIIDVAAVMCSSDGKEIKMKWHSRIRPKHPERATEAAVAVNGFSREKWVNYAGNNADIWIRFSNQFKGCVPVCHNPAFDRAFITIAAAGVGVGSLGVDHHWIGTESIAWPLYKHGLLGEKFSLHELCAVLNIDSEPMPHTALGGAELFRRLYQALMDHYFSSE